MFSRVDYISINILYNATIDRNCIEVTAKYQPPMKLFISSCKNEILLGLLKKQVVAWPGPVRIIFLFP